MEWTDLATALVLGLGAGVLSGMFGIGGGLVIVPALIILFKLEPKVAIGTSLCALLMPTGLLGAIEYYRRGEMRILHGAMIALGLFAGAYVGAKFTGLMSASAMKRAYGVFLVIVALYFFWTSGSNPSQGPRATDAPSGTVKTAEAGDQVVH